MKEPLFMLINAVLKNLFTCKIVSFHVLFNIKHKIQVHTSVVFQKTANNKLFRPPSRTYEYKLFSFSNVLSLENFGTQFKASVCTV